VVSRRQIPRTLAASEVAVAASMLGGTASAQLPAGPLGASQSQTWHVATPACVLTQAWQKQPSAVNVQSITFAGTVACASVPPNLSVGASIGVDDLTAEATTALNAPPVVTAEGGMGPSTSPESISLSGVLNAPKPGHDYDFAFDVSFVELDNPYSVDGVSGTPPQCMEHNDHSPADTGPPTWIPPSVDCTFVEDVAVP
jgi:hypothetical protein